MRPMRLGPAGTLPEFDAFGPRIGAPIGRQDGNTENLVFRVPHLIRYLSRHMVLEPGDVINTGTPAGVAPGLADNPYLRPGDAVSLEIDAPGTQTQTFAEA
jgi:2-keto-4-pentenoate hydratase/2-oxohepta-3-ene-1,7-dioic acid hydratase in catechol pathway